MKYKVLNEINVDSQAILANYSYFQSLHPHIAIAPVLKANAYGHGLIPIAQLVDEKLNQAPFICVDSLYEAYELSKVGIKKDILIMGYTNPYNYAIWKKLPFIFSVWDIDTLRALKKHQPNARIHLKIETGMHRLGIQPDQISRFIQELKQAPSLKVEGIFSHLSQADEPKGKTFTHNQLKLFKHIQQQFNDAGFSFKWHHLSATAGATIIHDSSLNLIRLGIGLYGYSPFGSHTKHGREGRKHLKPALTLNTHIAQLTHLKPGDHIGYGGTYQAKQHETIATLPLGYYEGIPRALSNRAVVTLSDNTQCQIVGNISMNMTTIKIPRTAPSKVGNPVTIISPDISQPNSLYQHTNLLKTIPYTMLVGLHSSIRRIII